MKIISLRLYAPCHVASVDAMFAILRCASCRHTLLSFADAIRYYVVFAAHALLYIFMLLANIFALIFDYFA